MVFVGMSQKNAFETMLVLKEVCKVWNDNIDAIVLLVRKAKPDVDDDQIVSLFNDSAVLADFSCTTQWDDFH